MKENFTYLAATAALRSSVALSAAIIGEVFSFMLPSEVHDFPSAETETLTDAGGIIPALFVERKENSKPFIPSRVLPRSTVIAAFELSR